MQTQPAKPVARQSAAVAGRLDRLAYATAHGSEPPPRFIGGIADALAVYRRSLAASGLRFPAGAKQPGASPAGAATP